MYILVEGVWLPSHIQCNPDAHVSLGGFLGHTVRLPGGSGGCSLLQASRFTSSGQPELADLTGPVKGNTGLFLFPYLFVEYIRVVCVLFIVRFFSSYSRCRSALGSGLLADTSVLLPGNHSCSCSLLSIVYSTRDLL